MNQLILELLELAQEQNKLNALLIDLLADGTKIKPPTVFEAKLKCETISQKLHRIEMRHKTAKEFFDSLPG